MEGYLAAWQTKKKKKKRKRKTNFPIIDRDLT